MAWEVKKVEELRRALVQKYEDGLPMTMICKEFGISRKTAYKWVNRCLKLGQEIGVKDLSKAPNRTRDLYGSEVIDQIIDLRRKKRTWGPRKLIARLEKIYPNKEWPSENWVYKILKEQQLIIPRKTRSRVPATHPLQEVVKSNDTRTSHI